MKTQYLSLVLILSGCSLALNPLKSLAPPQEVSPSPACEAQGIRTPLMAKINYAQLDRAPEFYRWAALEGYPQAQKIYGQWLIGQGQSEEGLRWLEKSAAQGCEAAVIAMAQIIGESDLQQALDRLAPLIERNNLQALWLASDLAQAQGQEGASLLYLKQAAEQGDFYSQAALSVAMTRQNTQSWSKVEHLSTSWDDESLMQELPDLALMWPDYQPSKASNLLERSDRTMMEEESNAFDWISPKEFIHLFAQASDLGSPYAALQNIRLRLSYPTLMPASSKTIAELAKIASVIPEGAVLEARLILKGWIPGSRKYAWNALEQAAGEKDPYALFACSMQKRHNRLLSEALKFYQEGLNQPNYMQSLFQASQDLLDGVYGFVEDQAAYDGLNYLAQSIYPQALLRLAQDQSVGKIQGTPEDIFRCRYQAAWQGVPLAQYLVGNMYLVGHGVSQSEAKAFRWFYQSARSGHRPAQLQISRMYEQGQGVIPSLVKAYAWRTVSVRGLHEDPQQQAQALLTQLTWDQLSEAVTLSTKLQAQYEHGSGVALVLNETPVQKSYSM